MAHQNELYTRVFREVRAAKTRFVVVYGSSASSKSYSVHQNELINLITSDKGDTLIIRKYAADLRESCYKLFKLLIQRYGLGKCFNLAFSGDNRRITYLPTRRSLVFRGIDDPEKLKSIVDFKRLVVEEANQLDFDDFLELNRRCRGMEGIQIILILNPVSEKHWIKTQLCDEDGPYHADTTVLRFTYLDNVNATGHSFLTLADIRELERLKEINENHYRIYVLAEWGIENREGKFCWAFNQSQIKPTVHDPERITWATFDFNINPLTCTVAQILPEEKTLRAIECIKLEKSDIWKLCQHLRARYPIDPWMWKFTGDATGQSSSALVRDNLNYYHVIRDEMGLGDWKQFDVPLQNPPVSENRLLVNAVHRNWNIEIDPKRCQPLIYDLTYIEVDGMGNVIKMRSNPHKYADFLDNWRYLINAAIKPSFSLQTKGD